MHLIGLLVLVLLVWAFTSAGVPFLQAIFYAFLSFIVLFWLLILAGNAISERVNCPGKFRAKREAEERKRAERKAGKIAAKTARRNARQLRMQQAAERMEQSLAAHKGAVEELARAAELTDAPACGQISGPKTCPKCDFANSEHAIFCGACGMVLTVDAAADDLAIAAVVGSPDADNETSDAPEQASPETLPTDSLTQRISERTGLSIDEINRARTVLMSKKGLDLIATMPADFFLQSLRRAEAAGEVAQAMEFAAGLVHVTEQQIRMERLESEKSAEGGERGDSKLAEESRAGIEKTEGREAQEENRARIASFLGNAAEMRERLLGQQLNAEERAKIVAESERTKLHAREEEARLCAERLEAAKNNEMRELEALKIEALEVAIAHCNALLAQRRLKLYKDPYGRPIVDLWLKEIRYFVLTSVIPKLSPDAILRWRQARIARVAHGNRPMIEYHCKRLVGMNLMEAEAAELTAMLLAAVYHHVESKAIEQQSPIDNITDPTEFEIACEGVLSRAGWDVRRIGNTGDQGADLIASRGGTVAAFQCKLYSKPVGNSAVQEIFAAKSIYSADLAAVISRNGYTKSARQAAEAVGVSLLDFEELATFNAE